MYTISLPTNGWEPAFEPGIWNVPGIQDSTNCYAYALNMRTGFPEGYKLQPGEIAGEPTGLVIGEAQVDVIAGAAADDAAAIGYYFAPAEAGIACPEGTWKVALAIDPWFSPEVPYYGYDYHWYRQDQGGNWSEKPGHGPVVTLNFPDPALAERGRYSIFGGYYCSGPGLP